MSSFLMNLAHNIFLFTYFFKENILFHNTKKVTIKGYLTFELKKIISNSLSILLAASYIEPSMKEVQENSTRFEKINIDGKIYKVNYRMSETGRLAYILYSLIIILNNADINEEILISYS